jgi:hypothetical protein
MSFRGARHVHSPLGVIIVRKATLGVERDSSVDQLKINPEQSVMNMGS